MDWMAIWAHAQPLWLIWLMVLFGAVLFWAFRPKNKARFEQAAQIPLKDDNGD